MVDSVVIVIFIIAVIIILCRNVNEGFQNVCDQHKVNEKPFDYTKITDSVMKKDGSYKGYLRELQLNRRCFRNDFSNNKQYACMPFDDYYQVQSNKYVPMSSIDYTYCPNSDCRHDYFDFNLDKYIVNPNDVAYQNYNCPLDYHGYVNSVYF